MKPIKIRVNLTFRRITSIERYGLENPQGSGLVKQCPNSWEELGIFREIFASYFEGRNIYFKDSTYSDLSGRIATTAHLYHYIQNIGMSHIIPGKDKHPNEQPLQKLLRFANAEIKESLSYGIYDNGLLYCRIPRQKPMPGIEDFILQHWNIIQQTPIKIKNEKDKQKAVDYKELIELPDLQKIYRWGYAAAQKLVPKNNHNASTLSHICQALKHMTDTLDPEEMAGEFHGMQFLVQSGEHLEWKAYFIKQNGKKKELNFFLKDKYLPR